MNKKKLQTVTCSFAKLYLLVRLLPKKLQNISTGLSNILTFIFSASYNFLNIFWVKGSYETEIKIEKCNLKSKKWQDQKCIRGGLYRVIHLFSALIKI